MPALVQQGILNGTVNLNDPATTLALLKLNAVAANFCLAVDASGEDQPVVFAPGRAEAD